MIYVSEEDGRMKTSYEAVSKDIKKYQTNKAIS
jgi:hypothetical protein